MSAFIDVPGQKTAKYSLSSGKEVLRLGQSGGTTAVPTIAPGAPGPKGDPGPTGSTGPADGFISQFGAVPTFFDDFNRTDRTLAQGAGDGESSPYTGHRYTADGTIATNSVAAIADRRQTWTDQTSFGATPIRIIGTKLNRTPTVLGGEAVFNAGTTVGQNAVIGACATSFAQGSVQLAIWPDQWKLFYVPNPIVDPYPVLASGTFATNLVQDGSTVHRFFMRYDPTTSSITYEVPGAKGTVTDSHINTYWGNRFCWQERREATTDGSVEFSNVAAHCPDSPQSGLGGSLQLPYATDSYVTTTPPNGYTPSSSGLRVAWDGLPTGGWASGSTQGIASWYVASSNHKSWSCAITAAGKPSWYLSTDGSTTLGPFVSTVAMPTNATGGYATFDPGTLICQFFYTFDGTSYTKLGADVTATGAGVPFANPRRTPFMVGTRDLSGSLMYGGKLSRVRIYDSAAGTNVIADADFRTIWQDARKVDPYGNLWKLHGTGWSWTVDQSAVEGLTAALASVAAKYSAAMLTTPTPISNTTTDTTFWTPTAIPAGNLAVGQRYRLHVVGNMDQKATSGNFTFRFKLGGSTVLSITLSPSVTSLATGVLWDVGLDITIETTGASGVVSVFGTGSVVSAASGAKNDLPFQAIGASTDLSGGFVPTLTAVMATADVANIIRPFRASLDQIA